MKISILNPLLILAAWVSLTCNAPIFGQVEDWPTEEISSLVQDELKLIVNKSLEDAELGSSVAKDATCMMLNHAVLELYRLN